MTITTADYDTIVVGGGPSGATAAHDLARQGHNVLLLERGFRIKPCGGAIPPCLLEEFDIPEHLLKARIRSARMVSPRGESILLVATPCARSGSAPSTDARGYRTLRAGRAGLRHRMV